MFKLGLIINPVAGLGGSVALKGSDGAETAALALERGAVPRAGERTLQALECLKGLALEVITYPQEMGQDIAEQAGLFVNVIGAIDSGNTTPEDTEQAARQLSDLGVDLILFAGGDGTARNICHVVDEHTPVLGIPAGVKIHSGVYAVTPKAAGEIVAMLVRGELVTLAEQEVRDIDEDAFRQGTVRAQYYGELSVPQEHRFLQRVKEGGKESEAIVLDDIAAHVIETMEMEDDVYYIMGSGSTVESVMEQLKLDNTLLGVDLVQNQQLVAKDCTAQQLLDLTEGKETRIVITLIGGQGHIIGRGNQQLTAELLRRVGKQNIYVIATKTKLTALAGRPLIVDSGDDQLNSEWSGLIPVITGYRDQVLYPVADF